MGFVPVEANPLSAFVHAHLKIEPKLDTCLVSLDSVTK
jgi:hypothetical protein